MERNEMELDKQYRKPTKPKVCSIKTLTKLTTFVVGIKERLELLKSEIEETALHPTEIKDFIRKYNEHLYASKFHNLNDMNKFLERCGLMKQTEERENVHKGPRRE